MINYYAVLEVLPNAPHDVIVQAYRRKAQTQHPDKGGDAEYFKDIKHAYDILSDPERRKRYDAGEDPSAPPLDVVSILGQLCIQTVQRTGDQDVIGQMYAHLLDEKQRAIQAIANLEKQAMLLDRTAARIKRKAGENFLAAVILNQAKQCRLQLAATVGAEARLDALVKALADFEYAPEPAVTLAALIDMAAPFAGSKW